MLMNRASDTYPLAGSASTQFARLEGEEASIIRGWVRIIGVWAERCRQRRALASLDERLLDDIGVSRAEAAAEIAKHFWR